jgi:acyl-CoA synthetase (AMP-forming)/AMP-acid ligase II
MKQIADNSLTTALVKAALTGAGLAYFNAKLNFQYDLTLMNALGTTSLVQFWRERKNSVSQFYLLEHWATSSQANHTFLVYEGREYSYKQTYDIVLKYGTWFKNKLGVKANDIVAIDFMNSDTFVFLWLGLWSIGAQPAFINYNLSGKPLLHCLRTSSSAVVIVDPEVHKEFTEEVVREIASPDFRGAGKGPCEVLVFDSAVESEVQSTQGIREPDSCRDGKLMKDMAILIYTSGTTGLPKPAIVSWAKCTLAPGFVLRWMGLKTEDRLYTCMPLYHSSAAVLGFCTTLNKGSTIVIGRKFSTRTFWNDVRRYNATIVQYVGETCRYLLAAEPQVDPLTGENLDKVNNVRIALGNGLRPDVWNKFKERFGIETIAEFYAATEGSSGSWNLSRNDYSKGAIGQNGVISQIALKRMATIVNVDPITEEPYRDPKTGFCKETPQGEAGELMYRLDENNISATFQGYYGNKEATEKKIMRSVYVKNDAYFRTGDMVRWNGGLWYFNDRLGDTFRWKSENVSTSVSY